MKLFKNISILAFLMLFATETFGIYKYVHFCGDEKTSESFFIEHKSCCCSDVPEDEDDCCTDQTKVIQLKEQNTLVSLKEIHSPEKKEIQLFHTTTFQQDFHSQEATTYLPRISSLQRLHPPPPLIIQYCTFLI